VRALRVVTIRANQPGDQFTYRSLSKHVRVFRNGVHVGDIRYFHKAAGWGFVMPGWEVGMILPTISEVKPHIEKGSRQVT
jgi:hypothetical protein